MARILIATDAWHPQVSGVVRTLDTTVAVLRDWGHTVEVVEPSPYWSLAFPFYPEVPMCLPRAGRVYERILKFRPDHIHISTEGGIGLVVRRFCRRWAGTSPHRTTRGSPNTSATWRGFPRGLRTGSCGGFTAVPVR